MIKLIEEDSWYLARTRGSHRQFKHPTKSGLVTIAGKPSDDLAPGTLNSIFKQAQLKEQRKAGEEE
ncbi:type II toxin-antitoxin system HicA family toxin [Microcoleus sp. FACHB-SPT15]|uniref:type II toxin-antitoxin system HicA family toxin n=1 Tax=Microcoleus sp. FACHB-SPT15 TaxID=2692830 RepID=UPI001785992C|nr:type II toxin-antitoxin system HicA family toxin [Microcoleus sp. FACHB-SPT15]MBD1809024.1 type II toxin-antitoxin system HicA family toxin [Microcoleus sp. FACHB-SPT15]